VVRFFQYLVVLGEFRSPFRSYFTLWPMVVVSFPLRIRHYSFYRSIGKSTLSNVLHSPSHCRGYSLESTVLLYDYDEAVKEAK
jgi:hypothetical protein